MKEPPSWSTSGRYALYRNSFLVQEFFLGNNIEFELKVILFSYLFSLSMLSALCVREKKSSTARMIIISQHEMWAVEC